MAERTRITRVEVHVFRFEIEDLALPVHGAAGVGNIEYRKGGGLALSRYAVTIDTEDGARGEYVTHWVGTPAALGQTLMLAPHLLGRDPDTREQIWDDLKRELRAYDHMGHGPLDIALWDLAGKRLGCSVSRLLGGFRDRLPTYASTYHGQESGGGLDSPEAFADYARACRERGFRGFKIHGWHDGDVAREIRTIELVRRAVGDEFRLMLDPACELRTWMDALEVGRACDANGFFWYEDPLRDSGISIEAHRRLRERLATPLLVSEYVRGIEAKAGFLLGGGCDLVHADPEYDMGITGAVKLAHLCEAFGLDIQFHACGPAHRQVMAATRNTHLYEMALVGPGMRNAVPPVYACGYSDQPEALDEEGCVPVPRGPGLGVVYDWDFIARNRTQHHVFTLD
ncbi:MAG: enolase C-terminal domain-like protein [Geminicoccaceae bacterium]|nr:enolase C-terminal domain-like protein [Geminicoccaceae bacterium]